MRIDGPFNTNVGSGGGEAHNVPFWAEKDEEIAVTYSHVTRKQLVLDELVYSKCQNNL